MNIFRKTNMRRKFWLAIIIITVVFALLVTFHLQKQPLAHLPIRTADANKTILWYYTPRYIADPMVDKVPLSKCPSLGCFVTRNKSFLLESSAVIFSAQQISSPTPPPREPGQVWIFHNNEPPYLFAYNRPFHTRPWASVFNWTMDFRHDADIVRPYAMLRKRPIQVKNYSTIVRSKTKLVAWMVSNCLDWSGRLAYAHELQKYVAVDIYGLCGNKTFPREQNSQWMEYLNATYKFYLAFENNFCLDYISEKFFNNFNLDLVTVARGGGNYSRDVPPGTYINTADFSSPKELADYILYLDNNVTKYTEILRLKDKYFYETEEYLYTDPGGKPFLEHHYEAHPLCELCTNLINLPNNSKFINDISRWFEKGICASATGTSLSILYLYIVIAITLSCSTT